MAKKPKVEIEDVPTAADMARGDQTLKKMLQTKPKPHKDMVGKHLGSLSNQKAKPK